MKIIITIFFIGLSGFKSFSQVKSGLYKGLERMCWTNDKGKPECYDAPRKWYHENLLLIDKDSFFIYKVPVQIVGNKKIYSASDGAFYYYFGKTQQTDTGSIVNLIMNNCDYCGHRIKMDTATGFMFPVAEVESYKVTTIPNGMKIGNVSYYKETGKENYFPDKQMFYYDSNNIYRHDPKGQYHLISTGIKNFLQTRELKLDNDTLRISIDRIHDDSIIETLNPEDLRIDTPGIIFKFYTRKELNNLTTTLNRPVRYVEVRQIIDYWKAARVSFAYVISLPKTLHKFSERQYSNLFEYNKVGTEYLLLDKLPENSWELVEQN
ncbi:MAG TPA: hypothetical protein VF008_18105 [Niastella sp.]